MAYQLPELPYAHDALEPHIDTTTMQIHHGKHHAAYVTNLNAALDGTEWMDRPIDAVLANLEILPADKQAAEVEIGADQSGVQVVGVVKLRHGWSILGGVAYDFGGTWGGKVGFRRVW